MRLKKLNKINQFAYNKYNTMVCIKNIDLMLFGRFPHNTKSPLFNIK